MAISDNLADAFIGYSVDTSRFSTSVERDVAGLLKKLEIDLVSSLNSYDITAPSRLIYRERRLRNLLSSVRETINESYSSINRNVSGSLSDLSSLEAASSRDLINNVVGASLATASLTPEFLSSIASTVSIEGAPAKEWWSRQSATTLNRFKDQIRIGMLQGEGVSELVRRVRGTSTGRRVGYLLKSGKQRYLTEFRGGLLDVSTRHAATLTRTAVLATSQAARFQMFQENSDVIKGMQALTTLDFRTSLICISRSGYSWTLDGSPIGKTRGRFPGSPPWHFNCRTVLIPVLYSFDEIAGNVSSRKIDRLRGSISPSTQASINGQVAEDLNYEGWLSLQSKARQLDVLGPSRYRLWKDGNIGFFDLVNSAGRPLTIKQLESKYGVDTGDLTSNFKSFGFKNLRSSSSAIKSAFNKFGIDERSLALALLGKRDYKSVKVETINNDSLVITGKRSKDIIEIERTLNFRDGIVSHNYLKITEDGQQSGISKQILKKQINYYQLLGFKTVSLVANIDIGAYAWARYGFDAVDWTKLRSEILDKVNKSDLDSFVKSNLDSILKVDHPAAIHALSSYSYRGRKVGKELLVGTEWEGSLNLTDKEAMRVFWNYIDKRLAI